GAASARTPGVGRPWGSPGPRRRYCSARHDYISPEMTGVGTDEPDDDSFLEDVVEEILGQNLPPPEQEDPWERRQRVLDTTTTVILSLAAVGTAWATFQASQWSEADSKADSASSVARS